MSDWKAPTEKEWEQQQCVRDFIGHEQGLKQSATCSFPYPLAATRTISTATK